MPSAPSCISSPTSACRRSSSPRLSGRSSNPAPSSRRLTPPMKLATLGATPLRSRWSSPCDSRGKTTSTSRPMSPQGRIASTIRSSDGPSENASPNTSVVTPCSRSDAPVGSSCKVPHAWLSTLTKPGATVRPVTSMTVASTCCGTSPTATIRSPSTATSARRAGAPVPSTTAPPRSTTVAGMPRVSGPYAAATWCGGDNRRWSLCHDGRASRRGGDATMSGVPVAPAAARLHASATVVDTHNDLLMLVSRRPPADQASYFRAHWLPQLQAGGVRVQVLPVFIDDDFRPEGALRHTLRMVEAAHRVTTEAADVATLCRTGAEIDATLAAGRIALVLALEGCEAIGTDVALLRTFARLGVRMVSFTHFGRTALADGSAEDSAGSRLTAAGVAAVRLLEELCVLIDVSHLSAAGTDHVLSLATRPVVASHSSAYALCEHHRNLTDDRLKGIAATGGVVGVNFFYGFIDRDSPTVGRLVDHIEHIAGVAGIDHVGLGPDFVKEVFEQLTPPAVSLDFDGLDGRRVIAGLDGPAGVPLLPEELLPPGGAGHPHHKGAGAQL